MNTKTDIPPNGSTEASKAAGAGCISRLVRESLTLQQVWNNCHPGCVALGYPFERPTLKARVVLTITGSCSAFGFQWYILKRGYRLNRSLSGFRLLIAYAPQLLAFVPSSFVQSAQ